MQDQRLPLKQIRASDGERDLTVERLARAFAEGRLDREEYDRRVDSALMAVRVGELGRLTADLPRPTFSGRRPRFNGTRRGGDLGSWAVPLREWNDEWRAWGGAALVLTGLWGITSVVGGALFPFWPVVPLAIWAALLLVSALVPGQEHT
ncbi:DUF1707 SHOCT-like domain-containing protein [Nocardiopsis kunsanensis]|uniref:DUF1707 domain-containing protein n=1 Tax=Nocardiopsis kunsanensis TaxID=141693 RepID=A0A918XEC0_9ACTN|nr:DUF1707 domain-containing protein [Nocardiopsis kunsanensis]GHD26873.1 hypothetical protein GCM10007147_25410 [Nocardiopsis kunsanensis]